MSQHSNFMLQNQVMLITTVKLVIKYKLQYTIIQDFREYIIIFPVAGMCCANPLLIIQMPKGLFPLGLRVDSQASPLAKCCELDVNSVSYL